MDENISEVVENDTEIMNREDENQDSTDEQTNTNTTNANVSELISAINTQNEDSNPIEEYLNSDKSITGRLIKKYNLEGK